MSRLWPAVPALWLAAACACLRPAEERALADLEVGFGRAGDVDVGSPAAHIRSSNPGELQLWANHPVVRVELTAPSPQALSLTVDNCMPEAELVVLAGDADVVPLERDRPTLCSFELSLEPGAIELQLAPPDHDLADPFRFAVMGDIQTALDEVDDIFLAISADRAVRFVVSTGDLVEENRLREYDLLLEKLELLPVPYFSTIGNHELWQETHRWSEVFGRHNLHFEFKDVVFSLVDTGNATIDPIVYDWLDGWLDDAAGSVHVYGQHYPAIDPIGMRQGSMRSRKEAAMLLGKLARAQVDVTFYGHIHSYYSYENAGIPAYISGGGGAWPERWDGIGRHFLAVDVDPAVSIESVGVVRVE